MAEPDKGTASSSNAKEKFLVLDDDISKNFLGSSDVDFNELDKVDPDVVLPTRTKELNKDDGDRGVKIHSTDKHEDQGSKIQLADTDAREPKSMLVKANLNPKVGPSLTSEKETLPQDDSIHLQNLPAVESKGTDGENNDPKSCNVLQGATVAENALHVKGSPLGAHAPKSISGRKKTQSEIASSHVSRSGNDDGNRGIKINSTDKNEDQGLKIELTDNDARDVDSLKAKSTLVKADTSKESLYACGGELETSSGRVEKKTCNDKSGDADSIMQDLNPSLTSENAGEEDNVPVGDVSNLGAHESESPTVIASSHDIRHVSVRLQLLLEEWKAENLVVKAENEALKVENAELKAKIGVLKAENGAHVAESPAVIASSHDIRHVSVGLQLLLEEWKAENLAVKAKNEALKVENAELKAENGILKQSIARFTHDLERTRAAHISDTKFWRRLYIVAFGVIGMWIVADIVTRLIAKTALVEKSVQIDNKIQQLEGKAKNVEDFIVKRKEKMEGGGYISRKILSLVTGQ